MHEYSHTSENNISFINAMISVSFLLVKEFSDITCLIWYKILLQCIMKVDIELMMKMTVLMCQTQFHVPLCAGEKTIRKTVGIYWYMLINALYKVSNHILSKGCYLSAFDYKIVPNLCMDFFTWEKMKWWLLSKFMHWQDKYISIRATYHPLHIIVHLPLNVMWYNLCAL